MMGGFNLSDWALKHRSLVWYFIIVSLVAGAMSYMSMGREEDPSFAIKVMVINAALPGATAEQTVTQVTDRIEKKLQELPNLKLTRSESYPGNAVVYVELTDETRAREVAQTWLRVRNMMADIRPEFPSEFAGFSFNDNFGDVYGNIYAFTGDGFSPREMKEQVEAVRSKVLGLKDVGKVELIGTQDPVVHLEFSVRRLAGRGLNRAAVLQTLAAQNAIVPSGIVRTQNEQIAVRVTGQFTSAEDLASAPLRVQDKFFTLADVATVTDGYADPPSALMRYRGVPAIGLAVGMRAGGNIIDFGEGLTAVMSQVQAELPLGIEMHLVADQPRVVEESVSHFVRALIEAVVIVLAVSFISLGWRAGLVVTMTIPLVLAMTFVILDVMGVTLQRISLGALIIALGLLVDDAMIAIETMISRLEIGESRTKAASYAWTSIAFPMLSGTLVTVAGFIPIGLNASQAGEYTISLFYVIAISLMLSWVVAVLFAPLLGASFLPKKLPHHSAEAGRLRRAFHRALRVAMRAKWVTIVLTLALFGGAVIGMRFVEQQFFPTSDRPEILIDVTTRHTSSFAATDAAMADLDHWLSTREEALYWSTYVGRTAPRFVLTLDMLTPAPFLGQIVVMTKDLAARDRLRAAIDAHAREVSGYEIFAKFLELGPPVGKPIQYRISGSDHGVLRDLARDLAARLSQEPRLTAISVDSNEPARVVRIVLDQERLRQMGLTQTDVSQALSSLYDGVTATQMRDGDTLIDIVARGSAFDRSSIVALETLQLANGANMRVPLTAFARFEWDLEAPVILQRNRVPTVTVKAAVGSADQPDTVVKDLAPVIAQARKDLPAGYRIEVGGVAESSGDSQRPILAVVPVMLLILLTIVMIQMQSFRLMFIVLAVAPLGLIGVVAALIPSGAPLGFVAILGVLALVGILIRNAIILVHEIEALVLRGSTRWAAVFEASDSRARPILLTAAAASLALIPIARQVFWGPMAYAMMGGIIAGTLITLLFAPALYCAVFRLSPPASQSPSNESRHEDRGTSAIS